MPLVRKPQASPPAATPDTLAALTNGTDDQRWAAARAAAALPASARMLGEAALAEHNPRVRSAIFTSLVRIATPESVEAVLPILRSNDAQLRTGALDALHAMRNLAWPYLPQLLGDHDADVRLLACELARDMPDGRGAALLCELLDGEPEVNVCASAVEVLAEVGDSDALPALERCAGRFRGNAFLEFSIKIATDRIRAQAST